jgi:hypothetical protein
MKHISYSRDGIFYRHEPEANRVYVHIFWRSMVVVALICATAGSWYAAYTLDGVVNGGSTSSLVTAPPAPDRAPYDALLKAFTDRAHEYKARAAAAAIVPDPSGTKKK